MSFTKLWRKAKENSTEFTVWTSLLDLVEKQQNIENARKAFESFFEHFPYCYGYWKKFAEMERHKGDKQRSLEVYRMGVKAIPLSIDLWVAYLDAAMEFYHGQEDYESNMRSLYEEALDIAGLEFRSDALWEHYISWESGHNRLANVVNIYTRLLQVPTQLYFQNWDSFNKLVEDNLPEDLLSAAEFARLHAQVSLTAAKAMSYEQETADLADETEPPIVGVTKPVVEITDVSRAAIRQLIIDSRERIYQATYSHIMKRWYFEEKIRRPYFHVKPLEEVQLTNWAEYLSFEEAEAASLMSTFKEQITSGNAALSETEVEQAIETSETITLARLRVRVLYERCLVACALYENFWIRYANYLEYTENSIHAAREVWRRACTVHLRYKPTIHWHWGCFEDRYPSNLDDPPVYPVYTCLDILTGLEERLTDSALVCCRRADAMRRTGKPLFDIIACIRSGINRLRHLAEEQTKVAKSVSGTTASRTVAQAIATASQSRAGAGVLAGRLARLLHRDDLCFAGVPVWMLLLHTAYNEESQEEDDEELPEKEPDDGLKMEAKDDDENEAVISNSKKKATDDFQDESAPDPSVDAEKTDHNSSDEASDTSDEDMENGANGKDEPEEQRVSDQSMSDTEMDDQAMDDSASPPILLVARPNKRGRSKENDEKDSSKAESKRPKLDEHGDAAKTTEDKIEKLVEEEVESRAPQKQKDIAAAEEERIRKLLDKRYPLVHLSAPPPESLIDEDRVVISGEEAAIRVLKEAIDYDPRNERLYAQLLDIVYQRQPVDVDAFCEIANMATIDSILPAPIKLAFCQRKLQFLEEFDKDTCRLRVTYEEYQRLCEAVNAGVSAVAIARGSSRLMPSYPLPDLLNLPTASIRVASVTAHNAADSLVSATPITRQGINTSDQSALEAAASVGTPIAEPSTSAGFYTAGAYEPLAAALGSTGGLPPPAPTNLPVITLTDNAAMSWTADPYASYYYAAAGGGASVVVSTANLGIPVSGVSSENTGSSAAVS